MRKRTIGILFMLAVLLNLWGGSALSPFTSLFFNFHYIPLIFFPTLSVNSIRIIILIVAATALLAAMVLSISAWTAVLIQHAKAQRWGFFVLTFFFGGIMLIIYLFTDSQPVVGGPVLSPQANFPQVPPAVPARQRRRQLFRFGLIAGGIIAAINIFWFLVTEGLSYVSPQFFSGSGPGRYAIGLPGMSLALFGRGIPLLLTLAAFFWAGKRAMQCVGKVSVGVDVALRAFLWLALAEFLLFISNMVLLVIQFEASPDRAYHLPYFIFLAWQSLQNTFFFLFLAFALGLPLAARGARTGTPGSGVRQAGPSASSQGTEQEVAGRNEEQLDDQEGNLVPVDHSLGNQNAPGESRPRIFQSRLIRGKHARKKVLVASILFASLGCYVLYMFLPAATATITITPEARFLDQRYVLSIAAQPNSARGQVAGRKLTYTTSTKTQTVPVHHTGHLDAVPASGSVVISISSLVKAVDLQDTQSVSIIYSNNESVVVDPVTIALQPGSTYTLQAHAVPAGASSNIPAHTIDGNYYMDDRLAMQFKAGYLYNALISNPEPFTGGRDAYDGPIVDAVDTQPVEQNLTTQLHQEARHAFQSQLLPGEALLNNFQCVPAVQERPSLGSPATSVSITASLKCTIGTYDATTAHAQILKKMNQLARQRFDAHLALEGPLQFTLVASDTPNAPNTLAIRAQGQWRFLLEKDGKRAVQQALAGLSQDDARMTLQDRYAARTLALETSWWWGQRLPLDPGAIQIVVRYPPS